MKHWSSSEISFLKREYLRGVTAKRISIDLERTQDSVEGKIDGLQRRGELPVTKRRLMPHKNRIHFQMNFSPDLYERLSKQARQSGLHKARLIYNILMKVLPP